MGWVYVSAAFAFGAKGGCQIVRRGILTDVGDHRGGLESAFFVVGGFLGDFEDFLVGFFADYVAEDVDVGGSRAAQGVSETIVKSDGIAERTSSSRAP